MKCTNEKNPQNFFLSCPGLHRRPTTMMITWRRLMNRKYASTKFLVLFIFLLLIAVIAFVGHFDTEGVYYRLFPISSSKSIKPEFLLNCAKKNHTQTCPKHYSYSPVHPGRPSSGNTDNTSTCPAYFRWIHEDLRPWKDKGITRNMIEGAKRTAHFRLVIVDGKAYVEKYRQSIQTRDQFTLWGILQLLRLYPGKLPDLELMFDCDDRPVVGSDNFKGPDANPPPLFRYCADESSLDIVFPDWSFWGWAEINIRPWKYILEDIKEGNKKTKWKDRVPYAFWKGNPYVDPGRKDLLTCNVSLQNDWNTRLYIQDWVEESKQSYKHSNLQDQCTHRYKIYIEGWAWSVSEKYLLACDSMILYVKPRYYDFYIRGMVPLQHYWPIRDHPKCSSLKFAVEWGNNYTQQAEKIGKTGSNFMQEEVNMDNVYNYMFHLLNEYAKLLKFKPKRPKGAKELCLETMASPTNGIHKKMMMESMVMSSSDQNPCKLPPPYDPTALKEILDTKAKSIRQVVMWEDEYWHKSK